MNGPWIRTHGMYVSLIALAGVRVPFISRRAIA